MHGTRKLAVRREMLGELDAEELREAVGGHSATPDCVTCQVTLRSCETTEPITGAYTAILPGVIKIQTS